MLVVGLTGLWDLHTRHPAIGLSLLAVGVHRVVPQGHPVFFGSHEGLVEVNGAKGLFTVEGNPPTALLLLSPGVYIVPKTHHIFLD